MALTSRGAYNTSTLNLPAEYVDIVNVTGKGILEGFSLNVPTVAQGYTMIKIVIDDAVLFEGYPDFADIWGTSYTQALTTVYDNVPRTFGEIVQWQKMNKPFTINMKISLKRTTQVASVDKYALTYLLEV